jgi:hypothetical protein
MEIIGLAASFAGLLALTGSVVVAGRSFYHPFKEFRLEIESLKIDVAQLEELLLSLNPLLQLSAEKALSGTYSRSKSALRHEEVEVCIGTLTAIKKVYEKSSPKDGRVIRNFSKRIAWPISRRELVDLRKKLDSHKLALNIALTAYQVYITLLFVRKILILQTGATL